ncbi:hypothetical protein COV24_04410 [candidate division WWE3 bacterium CG10_big_fil_rev_8_21_14_0_10_32_10]|uniref:Uncharacterized protein n=1 Tax=candidate division WWE3 bacterium CG10_big_fil_rev_8_21_14_0_10_32_10 TaxID=1975090 RepID=A0A2H0R9E9_UNCKA|nr:MAG: hypothetical protein COV24_04410 [candidate division WWE3 bacterium CG10_big_fil_rev_8_21_14_0_10_32_10]
MSNKNIILILVVLIALTFGAILYFGGFVDVGTSLIPGGDNTPGKKDSVVVMQEKQVIEGVTTKDFKTLMQENPDVVKAPNVQNAELSDKYDEIVKNDSPENYKIFFDGSSLDPQNITIMQGDFVTWTNQSGSTVQVRTDGWSGPLFEAGANSSQKFSFLGEYKYSVTDENGKVLTTGVLTVKPFAGE